MKHNFNLSDSPNHLLDIGFSGYVTCDFLDFYNSCDHKLLAGKQLPELSLCMQYVIRQLKIERFILLTACVCLD